MKNMADPAYNVGTNGPFSVALSQSLIHFNPQDAAMKTYEARPLTGPPVSVNAWTGQFNDSEKGLIIGNVVI